MANTGLQSKQEKELSSSIHFVGLTHAKEATVEVTESLHEYNEKPLSTRKTIRDARDLVTEILLVEDDPSLNPWTFRMWFIGLGMSVFAGSVEDIIVVETN